MHSRSRIIVSISLVLAFGCGGGDAPPPDDDTQTSGTEVVAEPEPEPEPEPPPPAPSPVRVLHAAAANATAAASASGGADLADIAFGTASAYAEVTGGSATLALAAGEATVEHTATLEPGVGATVVLYSGEGGALAALAIPDERGHVTGQARGRFVNAMLGAETLDLCMPGESRRGPGRSVISGVAYGDFGGIPAFPSRYQPMTLAGVDSIQVRAGAENACSGAVIGTAALPPIDINVPHNLTIVAVGRRTGRPAVARQLVVCEDHPTPNTCIAIPLR